MEDLWKNIPTCPQFKEFALEDIPLRDALFSQFSPVIQNLPLRISSCGGLRTASRSAVLETFSASLQIEERIPFSFL
jgi:hypothetical protein